MAFRFASANSPLRGLLTKSIQKIRGSVRNSSIFVEPCVPWLEKPSVVFSNEALIHHYGAIPLVVICGLGFLMECALILRLAMTRDDVYYTKDGAACDFIETRKGVKPPIRKLVVFNQKYENPPGLIEAVQGDVDGPPCKEENKKKGKK